MAVNRTMRLAEELCRSKLTSIDPLQIPSPADQQRLRDMRDAIEHNDDPILKGEAGVGLALALDVTDTDLSINRKGRIVTVSQAEFGGWTRDLHVLAKNLATDPGSWRR